VYGGSNKGQAVDTLVKDGDTFKIGKNIDVKCVPSLSPATRAANPARTPR
jgi:hypothetical protein